MTAAPFEINLEMDGKPSKMSPNLRARVACWRGWKFAVGGALGAKYLMAGRAFPRPKHVTAMRVLAAGSG